MNKPSEETIQKSIDGLASPGEAGIVAEWFATEEGQMYLSHRIDIQALHSKKGHEEIFADHDIPSDKMFNEIILHEKRRKLRRAILRAAAILIPFIFILGLGWQVNKKVDLFGKVEYVDVYVPKGERIQVMFQDGTKAYLNSDTHLRYPKKFGLSERKVFLDGEAYFSVDKNPDRPFKVQMNEDMVKVYGTEFNVKAYSSSNIIYLALDEGSIGLTPYAKEEYGVKPGEKLTYDRKTGECRVAKNQDTGFVSLWKKDVLAFRKTPLKDVLEDLNRWYDVPFIVEDTRAYIYSYTIVTENVPLEKMLADLEKISPVKFYFDGKQVIVSMK
jgi:ferric-dicitrate binding protein FerR (iron transport regulator)